MCGDTRWCGKDNQPELLFSRQVSVLAACDPHGRILQHHKIRSCREIKVSRTQILYSPSFPGLKKNAERRIALIDGLY
jgi:hypothetical protein